MDSPFTTCDYEDGSVGGFATAEDGNAIARYGVGEAKRYGPLSVRGASAQVTLHLEELPSAPCYCSLYSLVAASNCNL